MYRYVWIVIKMYECWYTCKKREKRVDASANKHKHTRTNHTSRLPKPSTHNSKHKHKKLHLSFVCTTSRNFCVSMLLDMPLVMRHLVELGIVTRICHLTVVQKASTPPHHTTPHHTTPPQHHNTTPHHTTPHHTTPHHTTPHHITQHSTAQHSTAQHSTAHNTHYTAREKKRTT